jgi:ATP-dependent DNA helicase RecG
MSSSAVVTPAGHHGLVTSSLEQHLRNLGPDGLADLVRRRPDALGAPRGVRSLNALARSDENLLSLLADLESDQGERKESLASKDRVYQAICAHSNDMPGHGTSGVIFIGATDGGAASGLAVTDQLLLELAGMRDQGKLLPPPIMHVRKLAVGDHEGAVVETEPSPSPPVRFDGQVWIRVGPRRALATADEERRLAEPRRSADLPFDARPLRGSELADLDLALFEREYLPSVLPREILTAKGRSAGERLATLRLASLDGTPTTAGLLILGVDHTRLPGAYVQFLRVDGRDLSAPIVDEKRLDLPLPSLLREVDDLLRLNIRTSVEVGTGLQETRQPDYPSLRSSSSRATRCCTATTRGRTHPSESRGTPTGSRSTPRAVPTGRSPSRTSGGQASRTTATPSSPRPWGRSAMFSVSARPPHQPASLGGQ